MEKVAAGCGLGAGTFVLGAGAGHRGTGLQTHTGARLRSHPRDNQPRSYRAWSTGTGMLGDLFQPWVPKQGMEPSPSPYVRRDIRILSGKDSFLTEDPALQKGPRSLGAPSGTLRGPFHFPRGVPQAQSGGRGPGSLCGILARHMLAPESTIFVCVVGLMTRPHRVPGVLASVGCLLASFLGCNRPLVPRALPSASCTEFRSEG